MIQEMHERLKRSNEHRNCGADEEIVSLRASIAEKDAEIERLRADAALGRAVRKIPDMAKLWHAEVRWYLHPGDAPCLPLGTGNTPEAALAAAGLMEGEGK